MLSGRGRNPPTSDCQAKSSMHRDTDNKEMICAIEVDGAEASDKWTCSIEDNKRGGGKIATKTFPEQSGKPGPDNTNG